MTKRINPYKRPDLIAAWKAGRRAGQTAAKHWIITGQQIAFNRGFSSALDRQVEEKVIEVWLPRWKKERGIE